MKGWTLGCLAATLLLPAVGLAQSSLEVKNEAFQQIEVENDKGEKELKQIPAEKVVPGTEVFFVTTVKNLGPKAAERVVVDNPMPEHMLYRGETPLGGAGTVEVSVDGGKRYGSLATLQVADAEGRKRPAEAADVTHVRFKMDQPLPTGGTSRFGFRAELR